VSEKLSGVSNTNVLVCGWYFHDNLGDDLFIDAFKLLFPNFNLTFKNSFSTIDLVGIDAVFIGGGSFLEGPLNINQTTLEALKKKNIFYIGVGTETNIHSMHSDLIRIAKLVAIRSPESIDKVLQLNTNVIVIPDLVYCLDPTISKTKIPNSILVLPNISLVPRWSDPHWKHAAWDSFKTEFAQFLDELVLAKHTIHFLPLCNNSKLDDNRAAYEIINAMYSGHSKMLLSPITSLQEVTTCISQHEAVITQRYHGIVLSNLVDTPCLTIHHHDKLKNAHGISISYYGISKSVLVGGLEKVESKISHILPIDRNMFTELIRKVENALCCN
jgi:polysaccharide pyruvyl transferase WcaK-like protein